MKTARALGARAAGLEDAEETKRIARPGVPQQDIVVTPRPGAGVDPVHALRRALKFALRACGLRCVGLRTVPR
jgi:hypothetical protein